MVVFGLAYCNAQETQAYIFGRNVRKFSKALIDDRPIYSKFTILNSRSVVALENDHKPLSYSYTHQSKMASMDLSPPQLMLQIRTNFN
ncbi:hypothetical protein, partial [Winogradskyella sp.]|uniref:hypothetical protein n=1 Tax=Winogradskyella sp. TaxID=1883156 RepID=UPI0037048FFB